MESDQTEKISPRMIVFFTTAAILLVGVGWLGWQYSVEAMIENLCSPPVGISDLNSVSDRSLIRAAIPIMIERHREQCRIQHQSLSGRRERFSYVYDGKRHKLWMGLNNAWSWTGDPRISRYHSELKSDPYHHPGDESLTFVIGDP